MPTVDILTKGNDTLASQLTMHSFIVAFFNGSGESDDSG